MLAHCSSPASIINLINGLVEVKAGEGVQTHHFHLTAGTEPGGTHRVLPASFQPFLLSPSSGTWLSPPPRTPVPSSRAARTAGTFLLTSLISFYTSFSEPRRRAPGSCSLGTEAVVAWGAPRNPQTARGRCCIPPGHWAPWDRG